jgi:sugar/nucleoside kinase (ribokinase family)
MRLEYPSSNVDERVIHVTSTAGAFTPAEVRGVEARAFVVAASLRGEVSLGIIQELAAKESILAADVQGFVRVLRKGLMVYEPWPERETVLAHVDVLKTDAVEAKMLTGEADIWTAARMLADMGPQEIVLTHRDGLLVPRATDRSQRPGRHLPGRLCGPQVDHPACRSHHLGSGGDQPQDGG